jgi:hypothetical protein
MNLKRRTMSNRPNCKYCGNPADLMDYREVDTIVSKVPSCLVCRDLSTNCLYGPPEGKFKALASLNRWFIDFANSVYAEKEIYDKAYEFANKEYLKRNPKEDEKEDNSGNTP